MMVAPSQTILNLKCTYKMKLAPGTLKKGKAAKSCLNFFINQKDTNQNDRKIMKNINEQEIINAFIGNVKLQAAGLLKVKEKEKLRKKMQKREADNKKKGANE